MILDHENQRRFLLEVMANTNFPGTALEMAFMMKRTIEMATLVGPDKLPPPAMQNFEPVDRQSTD